FEVGQSLLKTQDLTAFLEESIDRSMASLAYDTASIRLSDAGGDRFAWAVDRGYRDAANAPGAQSTTSGPPPTNADLLSGREPVVLEDLAAENRLHSLQRDGLTAAVWVPIQAG